MSFQRIPMKSEIFDGKEKDSLLTKNTPKTNHLKRERASSFTSKGSITLEAAAVIPIFFLAILCMVYLFEVIAIQSSLQSALQKVGKELADEFYVYPYVSDQEVEERVVSIVGEERLEDSMIAGGSDGLDFSNTKINLITGEMNLNVRYQIEIPVPFFHLPVRICEERLKVKAWNGRSLGFNMTGGSEMVYVSDYGVVYHKSLTCSYLELSVRSVNASSIGTERNQSGGKYYPCEKCDHISSGRMVYVTDYGNRYHTSLNCSGLKRTINLVSLEELNGIGGCSKCVY